jgi:hypothetical protein
VLGNQYLTVSIMEATARQGVVGIDGIDRPPSSGKTRSMVVLWEAPAQFLLHGGRVEHGDDGGEHGKAWECSERR